MKARNGKRTTDRAILNSVAESIGAALGTIAAKADAAQKALLHNGVVRGMKRRTTKLDHKSRASARKATQRAAAKLRKTKVAKAGRRSLRRASAAA